MNHGTDQSIASTPIGIAARVPVQVHHALGGSVYCGPAALSALTGLTTLETTNLLKSSIFGQTSISGVYYPALLKVLVELGYQYKDWGFFEKGGLYLVVLRGHVGVWWNGKFFDNSHPLGTLEVPSKKRIEKIFRIWKEETK